MNQNLNKVKLKDSRNSNWRQVPIGEFADFNPSESLQGGVEAKKIPMAMVKEFQRKIVGFEISNYNSGPKFRNGDTLVAKITPCLENGKTAFVDILEEGEVAFGSTEFIVLRENTNSNREFIYYLARSPLFREKAIKCMEGTSGRKRVNEGALRRQEILVPDIPTQQKIAKVLSDLDAKIELNNRINAELEEMAKLVYEYWFVQFDFPVGFDSAQPPGTAQGKPIVRLSGVEGYKSSGGKMVWNEELKREIPEGWEVKTLKEIAKTGSGGTPLSNKREYYENGNIPWINSGEVNNPFIISSEKKITKAGLENSSAKLFPKGTILMAMYGATAGKVSLIDFEASTNQAICAIIPNQDVFRYFIKFKLETLYEFLVNLSSGSARDNLSQEKIKELKFVIPGSQILENFHKTISPFMVKILENLKQNQQLSSLRDWLLPMLMNGQVTVAEAEIQVEEELGMVAEPQGIYQTKPKKG